MNGMEGTSPAHDDDTVRQARDELVASETASVLRLHGIEPDALIARGGESTVYALDEERVLAIHRGASRGSVELLAQFYGTLERNVAPFDVPAILEIGQVGETVFTIERRLRGVSLETALATLRGRERVRALTSFSEAVVAIRHLKKTLNQQFGDLLRPDPLQTESWSEYLDRKVDEVLESSEDELRRDVPGFERRVEAWRACLPTVAVSTPRLVHGDYFPGNVLVDGTSVVGVIDFSPHSVAGDPRLDEVGAVVLVTTGRGTAKDADVVRARLEQHGDADLAALFDFYRTYLSLYFSPSWAFSPRLYQWCVDNLSAESGG